MACQVSSSVIGGDYNYTTDPGPNSPPGSPEEGWIHRETYDNGRIMFYYDGSAWISHFEFTGTVGSVAFIAASTFFDEDNTNLYWDDSANELGIGAGTTPQATLDVRRDISTGGVARFVRSGSADTENVLYVGTGGATPDFAVFGDGRISVNTPEGSTNAKMRITSSAATHAAALIVDQNDTGSVGGLIVDTAGTTGDALSIVANSLTSGVGIDMDANALTSGRLAYFKSSSASVVSRTLFEILNSNSASINTVPFVVTQQAAESVSRFRVGFAADDVRWEIFDTGHWGVKPLASNTDVAPVDDTSPKKLSIQKRASAPSNAAYVAFSNNPGSDVFYLVLEELT